MDDFDYINNLYKAMEKYAKSIQPITQQLIDISDLNKKIVADMLQPYQNMAPLLAEFKNAISLPPSVSADTIKALSESFKVDLPNYIFEYQISSTLIEAIKSTTISIPNDIANISSLVIDSSNQLYNSLKELTSVISFDKITIDAMPKYLVNPNLSVAAHYKVLNKLQFYSYEENDKLDNDFNDDFQEASDGAEKKIIRTNSDWIVMLKGAEQSLISNNPDKIRHATTSLRELITQIIHELSPDDELLKIYTEDKWFHGNRPTRRARLHYIQTKQFGNDVLLDFIEKDIEAILSLFDIVNSGTHKVKSNISDEQLKIIINRIKLLIEQLLE